MNIKTLIWIALIFSLLGFLNAGFVYVRVQSGGPLPCFVVSGCDTVQASPYAYLFGIPLSLLGALYYLFIACGAFLFLVRRSWVAYHNRIFRVWLWFVLFGFLFSWYLFALQAFVIGAFCSSCLFSLFDMIFITASALLMRRRVREKGAELVKP